MLFPANDNKRMMRRNMKKYVVSVDQSTQGTKAMIFGPEGTILAREDLPHRQIVNDKGWVEHDPEEIWENTLQVIRNVAAKAGIAKEELAVLGISNQRETTVCWNRRTGKPVCNAVVWQCARAADLCAELEKKGIADTVLQKTGIPLSPYFPAAKLAWILRHEEEARAAEKRGELCAGTVDSFLVFRLTGGRRHQTDYSNASRTQLFNISTLSWDPELLEIFGIDPACLPEVTDSDGDFGETDLGGWLDTPIPIRGVLGDSHAALFGQGCLLPGMTKATLGTGSSVMMNIGEKPIFSDTGVVTSLAWKIGGEVRYVLEGNINYAGAVITWLLRDVQLISSPGETEALARAANPGDTTYLVPAFSGLGAPWWKSDARAVLCGMSRTTGKNEIVRAALACIAYQISDIVRAMAQSAGTPLRELRVDGGPTRNEWLMQFQSDILNIPVRLPEAEELSGIGAAYAAGLAAGIYDQSVFARPARKEYRPAMSDSARDTLCRGWLDAVNMIRG